MIHRNRRDVCMNKYVHKINYVEYSAKSYTCVDVRDTNYSFIIGQDSKLVKLYTKSLS
jgi:hypothetical protein